MSNEQSSAVAEKSKGGMGDFITETRREIAKVTWPTRKEITVTTMLIVVFALITGVFFLMVELRTRLCRVADFGNELI